MAGARRRWTDEALRDTVARTLSMAETLRQLGLVPIGGNYRTVWLAIRRLGLSTAHWTGRGWRKGRTAPVRQAVPLAQVLVRDSAYDRQALKRRLLLTGLLVYRCDTCGIYEWHGASLSLDLDHINGDDTDNRIENLRLLCPNCHSPTPTYCGRNKGRNRSRVSERPGWRNWSTRLP